MGRFQNWWSLTIDVFWPLWVGSLLVGLLLGVVTYIFVYYFVIYYRRKRPHLKLRLPFRRHRGRPKETGETIDRPPPPGADEGEETP